MAAFGQTFVVPQSGTLQEARVHLSRFNDLGSIGNFEVAVSTFDPTSGLRLETLASRKVSATVIDAILGSTGYIARFNFADLGILLNPSTTYLLSARWLGDFQILWHHGPDFTIYGSLDTYPGGNVVYLRGPDFSQIPEPSLACYLGSILAWLTLTRATINRVVV